MEWNLSSLTDGLIKPYQGFFVQNNGAVDNQSISFTSSKSSGGSFYGKQSSSTISSFEVSVKGNDLSNSLWIQFSENGDMNHSVLGDAVKLQPLNGPFVQVSSRKLDDHLDIIHLPNQFGSKHRIPLFVEATQSGEYTYQ